MSDSLKDDRGAISDLVFFSSTGGCPRLALNLSEVLRFSLLLLVGVSFERQLGRISVLR